MLSSMTKGEIVDEIVIDANMVIDDHHPADDVRDGLEVLVHRDFTQ